MRPASGSCFSNTLRCLAVDSTCQGEGLLNQIATHLINVQMTRGYAHLFLYTKTAAAPLFAGLGFFEIAHVKNTLVFMENRRNGFTNYLKKLSGRPGMLYTIDGVSAAKQNDIF